MMRYKLLLIALVTSTCFAMTPQPLRNIPPIADEELVSIASIDYQYPHSTLQLSDIRDILKTQAKTLSEAVINKVLTTMECAQLYNIEHNPILTIIDYSLPSNTKRLWIFNLKTKQLLFHTYVSHGIKSGGLLTTDFSNKYNSKSSSMGVYLTEDAYRGREGVSLRLSGLERGFNDNASNRSIVMHGGWYMADDFIKKYGRAGRSWGCPAVPLEESESIINTIKNNSLIVVYYPSDAWFAKSKFLNCNRFSLLEPSHASSPMLPSTTEEIRDNILFANVKMKQGETDPVVTMPANQYEQMFHTKAPLERMLRRQIDHMEYIALSTSEFKTIITQAISQSDKQAFNNIYFVIPHIKMERGYYMTEMKIVDLGKVRDIQIKSNAHEASETPSGFTVYFDNKSPVTLRISNQFIRWLGL